VNSAPCASSGWRDLLWLRPKGMAASAPEKKTEFRATRLQWALPDDSTDDGLLSESWPEDLSRKQAQSALSRRPENEPLAPCSGACGKPTGLDRQVVELSRALEPVPAPRRKPVVPNKAWTNAFPAVAVLAERSSSDTNWWPAAHFNRDSTSLRRVIADEMISLRVPAVQSGDANCWDRPR